MATSIITLTKKELKEVLDKEFEHDNTRVGVLCTVFDIDKTHVQQTFIFEKPVESDRFC